GAAGAFFGGQRHDPRPRGAPGGAVAAPRAGELCAGRQTPLACEQRERNRPQAAQRPQGTEPPVTTGAEALWRHARSGGRGGRVVRVENTTEACGVALRVGRRVEMVVRARRPAVRKKLA